MRLAEFRRLNPLDYSGTEAVNTICSNLSFAGRHVRKIVITSCNSGDGKSFMSVQIAYNLAQRGKHVLLIDLLNFLAEKYDTVLLDAPPIGVVIDAAEIARCCDGVVLVAKHGHTHRKEMITAKQQLAQTGCPILGCVLNDVSFDSISAKKYYNKSYYSHYGDYYRKSDKGGK